MERLKRDLAPAFTITLVIGVVLAYSLGAILTERMLNHNCEGTYYQYNDNGMCLHNGELENYQEADYPAWYLEAIVNNQ